MDRPKLSQDELLLTPEEKAYAIDKAKLIIAGSLGWTDKKKMSVVVDEVANAKLAKVLKHSPDSSELREKIERIVCSICPTKCGIDGSGYGATCNYYPQGIGKILALFIPKDRPPLLGITEIDTMLCNYALNFSAEDMVQIGRVAQAQWEADIEHYEGD